LPVKSPSTLDASSHYVIISTSTFHKEVRDDLIDRGFCPGKDFYDCFSTQLPYEIKIGNDLDIPIGRNTYYIETVHSLLSKEGIGGFTSINITAKFAGNHRGYAITTGYLEGIGNPDLLRSNTREPQYESPEFWDRMKITIGNDVWIGAQAFINTSKCHKIGDGAIIGANAVVNFDVPDYAVVVGVPGAIKKYRFSQERIEILQRIKWWNWTNDEIYKYTELLLDSEKFFSFLTSDFDPCIWNIKIFEEQ